jgi:hypothetical protein
MISYSLHFYLYIPLIYDTISFQDRSAFDSMYLLGRGKVFVFFFFHIDSDCMMCIFYILFPYSLSINQTYIVYNVVYKSRRCQYTETPVQTWPHAENS